MIHTQQPTPEKSFDIIGIGIGPFNLGLSALLYKIPQLTRIFFDESNKFNWHHGMLLPNTYLQISFLKDLVSTIDPTNPYSFLSFIQKQKRIYHFIHSNRLRVTRAEFNQYLQWVCGQLKELQFSSHVTEVHIENDRFIVSVNNESYTTKNLVIGTGRRPYVPDFAKRFLGKTLFHSSQFAIQDCNFSDKTVLVVGGGQSGAEIVNHLLDRRPTPRKIIWVTRRDNFLPLDDSPFVNEQFTPRYLEYFSTLSIEQRKQLVKKHSLFSDGISLDTLDELYQKIYILNYVEGCTQRLSLLPGRELISVMESVGGWAVSLRNHSNNTETELFADIIVLATGYKYVMPDFLKAISEYVPMEDDFASIRVREDYVVDWAYPGSCKLYFQNASITDKGVADPNLSLAAWRNAVIINSVAGYTVYDTSDYPQLIEWNSIPSEHVVEKCV